MVLSSHAQAQPIIPGAHRLLNADTPNTALAGEVLISELGCANCHDLPGNFAISQHIPQKRGPVLSDIAERATAIYIKDFVANPHETKPGTTMPQPVGAITENDAEAITHYLFSLSETNSRGEATAPDDTRIAEGGRLFHSVGCVACHAPFHKPEAESATDDFFAEETVVEYPDPVIPSVPLPNLAQKTSRTALKNFLLDPAKTRPAGRMPNLKLAEDEASALAAYLLHTSGEPANAPFEVDTARAEQGKLAFQKFACAQCHDDGQTKPTITVPALNTQAKLDQGCLAESPGAAVPKYNLSPEQRHAIQAALRELGGEAPDQILFLAAAFNCLACHNRDGYGGVEPGRDPYFTTTVDADLGDEGRIPPPLTGVGAKLTKEWLTALFTGDGEARPYMAARMPHFAINEPETLAETFMTADADPTPPEIDVTGLLHHHRNHYGRELMGANGLSCISCHDLNGHRSIGIPAIDLALTPERLQPAWYKKYMLDPASLRPGTRMPNFFPDGKSTYPKLFKGNASQQIEALWVYLREIDQTRLPEGMEPDDRYVLVPKDAPIVHRTFMENAGPRAIAVGFPQGVHLAFDANNVRFVQAWTGGFIDANPTWNDRFSPYVRPLGEIAWTFPQAPQFATELNETWPDSAELHFKGYAYNQNRTPVFHYTFNEMAIAEFIEPNSDGRGFTRTITIENAQQPLYFLAARGELVPETNGYEVPGQWRTEVRGVNDDPLQRVDTATPNELVFQCTPNNGVITIMQEVTW